MSAPTTPAGSQLPQITGSLRDVVEVKSSLAPVPSPVPLRRTRKDRLLQQANEESEKMRVQLQQFHDALQQERASRMDHVERARTELDGMRRQLDAAELAQLREKRFLRRTARILLPAGVTVLTISAVFIFALHVDWRAMPGPAPASAAGSSVEPINYPEPPPVSREDTDLPARTPRVLSEAASREAPEAYQMERLNDAIGAVPQNSVPEILTAVNKLMRASDGTPCWVASPSGAVSLAVSPKAGSHPLLSAFSHAVPTLLSASRTSKAFIQFSRITPVAERFQMRRSPYEKPAPFPATDQAELMAVRARLMQMDLSARAERANHLREVAKANAQISDLRMKLDNPTVIEEFIVEPVAEGRGWLTISIVSIVLAAFLIGFSMWYVDPLHTWDGHQDPAAKEATAAKSIPAHVTAESNTSESHAYSRLGEAVSSVPGASMPSVMNAANEWLGSTGEQACSVQSSHGEMSLVVSGKSGDKPLLAALSRCASAVEHFTQPTPSK